MVNVCNLQKDPLTLTIELAGGSGTRSMILQGFAVGQITDAEYTKSPDYYNSLVVQGLISVNSGDVLNQVEDEPAIGQIGSAH